MIEQLLISALSYSTPLLLAALGGYFSEKAGVVNIALEGKMLLGAFFGVIGVWYTGNILIGLMAAVAAGGLAGFLHGVVSVYLKSNHIISGLVINLIALGLTGYFMNLIFEREGSTPPVKTIPPGPADLPWLLILAVIAIFSTEIWSRRFTSGLRHRAAGISIWASLTAGIDVKKIRVAGSVAAGFFAGLAGAQLSIGELGSFVERMTAGKGFIALAALILARWRPLPILATAFFFGFTEALAENLESFLPSLPADLILMIPFVVTLLVLAGFISRTYPPADLGKQIMES